MIEAITTRQILIADNEAGLYPALPQHSVTLLVNQARPFFALLGSVLTYARYRFGKSCNDFDMPGANIGYFEITPQMGNAPNRLQR